MPKSDDGNLIESENINNDDDIFLTPTGKKPRGRQQMIDSQTDITEDFLFDSNLDYFEYDKISTYIEEISLVKKALLRQNKRWGQINHWKSNN